MVDSIVHGVNHDNRHPDLIQEGVVALMGAMVDFDPKNGEAPIEAYAKGEIKNAIEMALAKGDGKTKGQGWLVQDVLTRSKSKGQGENERACKRGRATQSDCCPIS